MHRAMNLLYLRMCRAQEITQLVFCFLFKICLDHSIFQLFCFYIISTHVLPFALYVKQTISTSYSSELNVCIQKLSSAFTNVAIYHAVKTVKECMYTLFKTQELERKLSVKVHEILQNRINRTILLTLVAYSS